MPQLQYIDWHIMPYAEALARQEALFQQKINQKMAGQQPTSDFILLEHLPVYTLGKHGKAENMLLSEEQLQQLGASLYRTNRGGDITFHGIGQITGYPIFNLEQWNMGLKTYIHTIEEMIIRVIAAYGLQGERLEGATGVWLDAHTARARKICAIGVRASRYVTMHGFALNVNTDLRYFSYINPCGFTDKGVTSIAQEIGHTVAIEDVKQALWKETQRLFQAK